MPEEKILERVRKLLAQAEDQSGTEEGDTFSAMAEKLMIRHGIEQAVLDEAEGRDKGEVTARRIWCSAPYSKQKASLLCTVAVFNQGKAVIHTPRKGYGKGCAVSIYGFERDLESIEFLFTSLALQATQALTKRPVPADRFGRRMDPATFRSGWLMDFDLGVTSRMREMQQDAEQEADAARDVTGETGANAAVVVRDKQQQISDHVAELYPHLGQMRMRSSGVGQGDGFSAGRSADLGAKRFGSSRKQLSG